jgi:hypothetical protein
LLAMRVHMGVNRELGSLTEREQNDHVLAEVCDVFIQVVCGFYVWDRQADIARLRELLGAGLRETFKAIETADNHLAEWYYIWCETREMPRSQRFRIGTAGECDCICVLSGDSSLNRLKFHFHFLRFKSL